METFVLLLEVYILPWTIKMISGLNAGSSWNACWWIAKAESATRIGMHATLFLMLCFLFCWRRLVEASLVYAHVCAKLMDITALVR